MLGAKARSLLTRRDFNRLGVCGAVASVVGASTCPAQAAQSQESLDRWIAKPPAGFHPLRAPGKITKVTQGTDLAALMQANQLWPRPEPARAMLERALMDFTGASSASEAMKRFIHKDDIVAIKVNGIAGQNMAVNWELIVPVVEAVLAVGVPADKVTVYEQYPNFLSGTRVGIRGNTLPSGVKARFHSNQIAQMPEIKVCPGIPTKYAQFLTDASAVINMSLIKDHSICGYTGTLKNMTHGSVINPHHHHSHQANPQIALLYNHPIVRSRVRLHITDGFKILYDQGPLDKNPRRRILHGAVYVATDPVAMDTLGWKIIDEARQANGLRSLAEVGREPRYIRTAGELGLGVSDLSAISVKHVAL